MNRRTFLHGSLTAALAGSAAARAAWAQTPPTGRARAAGPPAPPPAPAGPRKLVLDVNSRALQWMRTADELADAAVEMVVGGVCLSVQP